MASYLAMIQMYQMYSRPMINYLDSPLHNSSSGQLVSYLNAIQTNQSIFENKWSGTWTPQFTTSGDLVDYQYGPAGVHTNALIERSMRPDYTLESYINPRGTFNFR